MFKFAGALSFALTSCLALSGCLVAGGGVRHEILEDQRLHVSFESISGAHEFHDGLESSDRANYTDGHGLMVFGLLLTGGAVFHETAHYNAQIRIADTDRDSFITDEEAHRYRERVGTQPR